MMGGGGSYGYLPGRCLVNFTERHDLKSLFIPHGKDFVLPVVFSIANMNSQLHSAERYKDYCFSFQLTTTSYSFLCSSYPVLSSLSL